MIAIFRFTEGIDWNSMDGQPVKIAVALIMPDGDGDNTHLKVLSKLSRKMVHQEFMETLLNTEDPQALYSFMLYDPLCGCRRHPDRHCHRHPHVHPDE